MLPSHLLNEFRSSLFRGQYNLLFGSGISTTSTNHLGNRLQSTDELRASLCRLKNANASTSLSRICQALLNDEVQQWIIDPYSGCIASSELLPLSNYIWRRVFTFNIDDVIE